MIEIIEIILLTLGMLLVASDILGIPYLKNTAAIENIYSAQTGKISLLEALLRKESAFLSKKIKLEKFKRMALEADLRCAGENITPEQFVAKNIVKASFVFFLSLPLYFIFAPLGFILSGYAVLLYFLPKRKLDKTIKARRERIECELPNFVCAVEKTLKHSRDVMYMIELYRPGAGGEFGKELDITLADMKSGNAESAITRLEARVGSAMLSDVCRGFISVIRGDDSRMYWQALGIKFSAFRREKLKAKAAKIPKRVNILSISLLVCFMLTYIVVILSQIVSSLGQIFF